MDSLLTKIVKILIFFAKKVKKEELKTMKIKKFIQKLIPFQILKWRSNYFKRELRESYDSLSVTDVFGKIYKDRTWGVSETVEENYFSGGGSHNQDLVGPYVIAVRDFIEKFTFKPDVVDLGCGDFAVGEKIRHFCAEYTAIDIVDSLISRNKEKYSDLSVNFKCMNAIDDDLPIGDVVFIRQVFQHLSNNQISKILEKVKKNYKFLILTESLPADETFRHNDDKPAGPDCRYRSGIVVTSPPFNLIIEESKVLCEVKENEGIIKTIIYKL